METAFLRFEDCLFWKGLSLHVFDEEAYRLSANERLKIAQKQKEVAFISMNGLPQARSA